MPASCRDYLWTPGMCWGRVAVRRVWTCKRRLLPWVDRFWFSSHLTIPVNATRPVIHSTQHILHWRVWYGFGPTLVRKITSRSGHACFLERAISAAHWYSLSETPCAWHNPNGAWGLVFGVSQWLRQRSDKQVATEAPISLPLSYPSCHSKERHQKLLNTGPRTTSTLQACTA